MFLNSRSSSQRKEQTFGLHSLNSCTWTRLLNDFGELLLLLFREWEKEQELWLDWPKAFQMLLINITTHITIHSKQHPYKFFRNERQSPITECRRKCYEERYDSKSENKENHLWQRICIYLFSRHLPNHRKEGIESYIEELHKYWLSSHPPGIVTPTAFSVFIFLQQQNRK